MENQIPDKFPSKLQARTLELYDRSSRHITNRKISENTGLTEAWLSDFLNGKIKKPPAGKLEALYNYLSNTPFDI